MLIVFFMGVASGLPYALVGQTLKAWAKDANVPIATIGLLSILAIPYSLKIVVGPFLDHYIPPFLGRRRGWLALMQVGVIASLFGLSLTNPEGNFTLFAGTALLVAIFSATQDIVIDAYRREFLPEEQLGFGNSVAIAGYILAFRMISGALALYLSSEMSWSQVYAIMGAISIVGLATTLLAPEPKVQYNKTRSLVEAIKNPLVEFFARPGALWIIAFIFFYKVGDSMASQLATPFYLDLHYSKTEIAAISKLYGFIAVIAGGLIGGAMMAKIGLRRSLWTFGFLQAISTAGFAWLAQLAPTIDPAALAADPSLKVAPALNALIAVISFENLTAGMGTAAYSAFMASLTNKNFTATQYALLTSIMGLTNSIVGAPTGYMVEAMSWTWFFVFCTFAAVPGLLLLLKVGKWAEFKKSPETPQTP